MKTNFLKFIKLPILLFLLFCFSFFSCGSDSKTKNADTTEKQEISIVEEKKEIEVSFMLSNVEDDINGTESTITAVVNGEKVEVTKATNCNVVEKQDYESMKVPADARWACACWWAGAGENFYAIKKEDKVEFYGKEVYEEMEKEYDKWELIKTLE